MKGNNENKNTIPSKMQQLNLKSFAPNRERINFRESVFPFVKQVPVCRLKDLCRFSAEQLSSVRREGFFCEQ